MPLRHYLQLALTEGIGPILMGRLIEAFGSAERAVSVSLGDLRSIEGIGATKAQMILTSLRGAGEGVEAEMARAAEAGVRMICPEDEVYPLLLRSIPDPPAVLYIRGTLEPRDLNSFALVGSRKCSYYGREQAERFGALVAGAGFTVVSGGARGVDSAAHRGAMQPTQGRTIAVLGCGVDKVYPPENAQLFEQIAKRGAVMSEYPMGSPPLASNFPRRNRIVSGMSRGVLVVEADERSGALITARQAADDHNRPVFALPGRVDNALSAGPHKLIRDGAILTANLEDILQGLGPLPQDAIEPMLFRSEEISDGAVAEEDEPVAARAAVTAAFTERQSKILAIMGNEPMNIDLLVDRSSYPAHEVLQEMTLLTLRGLIKRVDGQTFVRHNLIRN
jgi:DNA processing protein